MPPKRHPALSSGRTRRTGDLSVYPKDIRRYSDEERVVSGDAHGSALKIIYELMCNGILKLNNEEDYNLLLAIMEQSTHICDQEIIPEEDVLELKQCLEDFKKLLERAEYQKDSPLYTLIGDHLADRGPNDLWTLLLIQALHKHEVNFEIMFSNHSNDLGSVLHHVDDFLASLEGNEQDLKEYSRLRNHEQGISLVRLFRALKAGVMDHETFKDMIKINHDATKLISYDVCEADKTIILYTHAMLTFEVLEQLAKHFGVPYKDETMENVCSMVDQINDKFTEKFRNPSLFSAENCGEHTWRERIQCLRERFLEYLAAAPEQAGPFTREEVDSEFREIERFSVKPGDQEIDFSHTRYLEIMDKYQELLERVNQSESRDTLQPLAFPPSMIVYLFCWKSGCCSAKEIKEESKKHRDKGYSLLNIHGHIGEHGSLNRFGCSEPGLGRTVRELENNYMNLDCSIGRPGCPEGPLVGFVSRHRPSLELQTEPEEEAASSSSFRL